MINDSIIPVYSRHSCWLFVLIYLLLFVLCVCVHYRTINDRPKTC